MKIEDLISLKVIRHYADQGARDPGLNDILATVGTMALARLFVERGRYKPLTRKDKFDLMTATCATLDLAFVSGWFARGSNHV